MDEAPSADGQLWLELTEASGLFPKVPEAPARTSKRSLSFLSGFGAKAEVATGVQAIAYFRITVGNQRARSTSQFLAAPAPKWHEEYVFATRNRQEERIHLELYDRSKEEAVLPDRVVGECFIPIARLPEDQEVNAWYQLFAVDAQPTPLKAAVRLRMRYQSAHASTTSPPEPHSPRTPDRSNPSLPVLTSGGLGAGLGLAAAHSDDEAARSKRTIAAWRSVQAQALRQVEQSERVSDELAEVCLPVALLDYVVFCGPRDSAVALALQFHIQEVAAREAEGTIETGDPRPVFWANEGDAEVLERFPQKEHEDLPLPTKVEWFCYPNGIHFVSSGTRPAPRISAFVMESSGERCFVVSLTFYHPVSMDVDLPAPTNAPTLWAPYTMALLSRYPHLPPLRDVLVLLHDALHSPEGGFGGNSRAAMAMGQLLGEVPLPIPGALGVRYFGLGVSVEAPSPPLGGLPLPVYGLGALFARFGLEAVVDLWAATLLEQKILFHSADYAVVPAVTEALRTLLYPLRWQHLYVPVLPNALLDYLEAPVPFILGVTTKILATCEARLLSDILVVDCDRGSSTGRPSGLGLGLGLGFPTGLRRAMIQHLQAMLQGPPPSAHGPRATTYPSILGSLHALCAAQHGGAAFSERYGFGPDRNGKENQGGFPGEPGLSDTHPFVGESLRRWPSLLAVHGATGTSDLGDQTGGKLGAVGNVLEHGVRTVFLASLTLGLFRVEECIYHLDDEMAVFNEPAFLQKSDSNLGFEPFLQRLTKTESFQLFIGTLDAPECDAFAKMAALARCRAADVEAAGAAEVAAAEASIQVQLASVAAATAAAAAGEEGFRIPTPSGVKAKAGEGFQGGGVEEQQRAMAQLLRCQASEHQKRSEAFLTTLQLLRSLADAGFSRIPRGDGGDILGEHLAREKAPGDAGVSDAAENGDAASGDDGGDPTDARIEAQAVYDSALQAAVALESRAALFPMGPTPASIAPGLAQALEKPPMFVCTAQSPRRTLHHSTPTGGAPAPVCASHGGTHLTSGPSTGKYTPNAARKRRRQKELENLPLARDVLTDAISSQMRTSLLAAQRRPSESSSSPMHSFLPMTPGTFPPAFFSKVQAALAGRGGGWLEMLNAEEVEAELGLAAGRQWTFGDTPAAVRRLAALLMRQSKDDIVEVESQRGEDTPHAVEDVGTPGMARAPSAEPLAPPSGRPPLRRTSSAVICTPREDATALSPDAETDRTAKAFSVPAVAPLEAPTLEPLPLLRVRALRHEVAEERHSFEAEADVNRGDEGEELGSSWDAEVATMEEGGDWDLGGGRESDAADESWKGPEGASGEAASTSGASREVEARVKISGRIAPSVGASGAAASSIGPSGETASSAGASGETESSVASSGGMSGETEASVGASGETESSVGASGETESSVGASGETEMSVGASGETESNVGASGETESSAGASGEAESSVGASGETEASVGASGETESSIGASGEMESSVGASGEIEASVGASGGVDATIGASREEGASREGNRDADVSDGEEEDGSEASVASETNGADDEATAATVQLPEETIAAKTAGALDSSDGSGVNGIMKTGDILPMPHASEFMLSMPPGPPPSGSQEASPRVAPRVSPKVSPRVSARVSPRISPRVSPRVSPRASPRQSPKVSPGTSPKGSPKGSPQGSPKGSPKSNLSPRGRGPRRFRRASSLFDGGFLHQELVSEDDSAGEEELAAFEGGAISPATLSHPTDEADDGTGLGTPSVVTAFGETRGSPHEEKGEIAEVSHAEKRLGRSLAAALEDSGETEEDRESMEQTVAVKALTAKYLEGPLAMASPEAAHPLLSPEIPTMALTRLSSEAANMALDDWALIPSLAAATNPPSLSVGTPDWPSHRPAAASTPLAVESFTATLLQLVLQRVFAGQTVHPTGVARVEKLLSGSAVSAHDLGADLSRAGLRRRFLDGLRAPRLQARVGAQRAVALARRGDLFTSQNLTEMLSGLRPELRLDAGGYEVLSRLCVACVASCETHHDYASAHELLRLSQCFFQEHNTGESKEGSGVLKEYLSTSIQRQAMYCEPALWEFVLTQQWRKHRNAGLGRKERTGKLVKCVKQVLIEMAVSGLSLYHALSFIRRVAASHSLSTSTASNLEMEAKGLWENMSKSRSALTLTLTLALTHDDFPAALGSQPAGTATSPTHAGFNVFNFEDARVRKVAEADDGIFGGDHEGAVRGGRGSPDAALLLTEAISSPGGTPTAAQPLSPQAMPPPLYQRPNPNLSLPMEEVSRGFGAACPLPSPNRKAKSAHGPHPPEMLCTFLGRNSAKPKSGKTRRHNPPLCLASAGPFAMAGDSSGTVTFYHLPTARTLHMAAVHESPVTRLVVAAPAMHPNASPTGVPPPAWHVVSGGWDGSLRAWALPSFDLQPQWVEVFRVETPGSGRGGPRTPTMSPGQSDPSRSRGRKNGSAERPESKSFLQRFAKRRSSSERDDEDDGGGEESPGSTIPQVWQGQGHPSPIRGLDCVPMVHADGLFPAAGDDCSLCFSGGEEGFVRVWALPSGRCLATLDPFGGSGGKKRGGRGSDGVSVLRGYANSHPYVAAGHENGEVRVWRVSTDSGASMSSSVLRGHTGTVTEAVWVTLPPPAEEPQGQESPNIPVLSPSCVNGMDALPADLRLVTSSLDRTIRVWDPQTSNVTQVLAGHSGGVLCLAVHKGLGLLLSGAQDCNIKVWALRHMRDPRREQASALTFSGHRDAVGVLAIATESLEDVEATREGRLFSAGEDGCLKEWSLETGEELQSHYGHTEGMTGMVRAGEGHLVTGSWDGSVRVWSR